MVIDTLDRCMDEIELWVTEREVARSEKARRNATHRAMSALDSMRRELRDAIKVARLVATRRAG